MRGLAQHPCSRGWIYAATETGIFTSEDGGASWRATNDGPANVAVDEVVFLENSARLLAATHGRGLWTADVPAGPDPDGDGLAGACDNCPFVSNAGQADGDGDGAGAACDCNDASAAIWSPPGEVSALALAADGRTLSWAAPLALGATAATYDTLRSTSPADFTAAAATCVETGGGDLVTTDTAAPGPGALFSYLVRARNGCAAGTGTLGSGRDGTERNGRTCP